MSAGKPSPTYLTFYDFIFCTTIEGSRARDVKLVDGPNGICAYLADLPRDSSYVIAKYIPPNHGARSGIFQFGTEEILANPKLAAAQFAVELEKRGWKVIP